MPAQERWRQTFKQNSASAVATAEGEEGWEEAMTALKSCVLKTWTPLTADGAGRCDVMPPHFSQMRVFFFSESWQKNRLENLFILYREIAKGIAVNVRRRMKGTFPTLMVTHPVLYLTYPPHSPWDDSLWQTATQPSDQRVRLSSQVV